MRWSARIPDPRIANRTVKNLWFLLACLLAAGRLFAASLPYDERADARAEIRRALLQAGTSGKQVLLVFGANWCPDCRRLDASIYDDAGRLGPKRFLIVKVDVGDFDKNIDLAQAFGNPIRKGIPGAAIVSADRRVLYAGPLSHLVESYRHALRMGLKLAAAAIALAVVAGLLVRLRRRSGRRAG